MTAISILDATKLSFKSTPKNRWPDPQASTGAQCASLDILGIYKCWEIKDKSPAHAVWQEIHRPILSLIQEQFEHLNARGGKLLVSMFMVGRKEVESSPTLLVSCESKPPRRMALDLIQKKNILLGYPGVRMADCSKFPKPQAQGDSNLLPYFEGVYLEGELRSFGTAVLVSIENTIRSRRATVGGLIRVGEAVFGLTVGHVFDLEEKDEKGTNSANVDVFSIDSRQQTAPNDDIEFQFYEPRDSDDGSEEDVELTKAKSCGSGSPELMTTVKEDRNLSFQDPMATKNFEYSNEDIALAHHISTSPPFRLYQLYIKSQRTDLDWALIEARTAGSETYLLPSKYNWINQLKSSVLQVAQEPDDHEVLICIGREYEPFRGRLSATPSYIQGHDHSQELWSVTLDDEIFRSVSLNLYIHSSI